MEFDWSPRPMAPMFHDEAFVPGIEDDETGAGSDFFVWDNVLPESAGQAHNVPSPMSVQAPGIDLGTSLASKLRWRPVSANAHSQTWLYYQGREVPIDTRIAPLVKELWAVGFVSLACCEGHQSDAQSGYLMFSEPIGKEFMVWAERHKKHLSQALRARFEILLQDGAWHRFMAQNHPLLEPVGFDGEGRLFTVVWRFDREELLDHLPTLIELLRAGRL
jgi:hypothetical protein